MLRHRILCVGRKAKDPLLQAADSYLERLQRYAPAELIRVKESDPQREGDVLWQRVPERARVVLLDERGASLTTLELAERLRSLAEQDCEAVWMIGGADGFSDELRERAKQRGGWSLSLSPLTLPHRLALVVILEQLYRAHTVLRGEKYHRP